MRIPEDIKKELTEDLRQAIEDLAQNISNDEAKNKIYESTKKFIDAYNGQKRVESYFDEA